MCATCLSGAWCSEHAKYMPGHYDGDGCVVPDAGHFNDHRPRVVIVPLVEHPACASCDGTGWDTSAGGVCVACNGSGCAACR